MKPSFADSSFVGFAGAAQVIDPQHVDRAGMTGRALDHGLIQG
jgi:hypothetical protein